MRPVKNDPVSNEKKLIISVHSTIRVSFSCKACFEKKNHAFYFWSTVPLTCAHMLMQKMRIDSIQSHSH